LRFPSISTFKLRIAHIHGFRRQVGLEVVDLDALSVSNTMIVHALHFKTKTERNTSHTLSPATASDSCEWDVSYDLSTPQLLQAMCDNSTWKSSVIINLTLLEGHADTGISARCPFCRISTSLLCVWVHVCLPSREFHRTHVLLMVCTAGVCEGDSQTGFDIDSMQAAATVWIQRLLAKLISKNIALAANQGGRQRVVAVRATGGYLCFLSCDGLCIQTAVMHTVSRHIFSSLVNPL